MPAVDVLIVGARPTGLTLAVDLSRRGVRAVLIEAAPAVPHQSRGKGLQPRSLKVLDDLGVIDAALGHGQSRQDITLYRDGRRLARIPAGLAEPRADLPYPKVVKPTLEALQRLWDERTGHPQVRLSDATWGWRVTVVRHGEAPPTSSVVDRDPST